MSNYTFSVTQADNFLSTGCFYLFDTIDTASSFGSDVFKHEACVVDDQYTAVLASGDFTRVVANTGAATTYPVGDLMVICDPDHKMVGVHRITANPSSGVFAIDLPWESCFTGEDPAEFYVTAAGKVDNSVGETIIGDQVCMAGSLPVNGVHRFVQYTSVAYSNCNTELATRCSTTTTVTTFSGDDTIDNPMISYVGGICPPHSSQLVGPGDPS